MIILINLRSVLEIANSDAHHSIYIACTENIFER
jgi:hypothetical protein